MEVPVSAFFTAMEPLMLRVYHGALISEKKPEEQPGEGECPSFLVHSLTNRLQALRPNVDLLINARTGPLFARNRVTPCATFRRHTGRSLISHGPTYAGRTTAPEAQTPTAYDGNKNCNLFINNPSSPHLP